MSKLIYCIASVLVLLSAWEPARSQTITWSGRTWKVTTGHMAGVALGDPANVTIDEHGYLHLRIARQNGKWTAAEVFTTEDFGFGTYQWIVEGNVYAMDPTTVLGLFTYGPVHHKGADAEDEIDIEFSQWNKTCQPCNADFTVYPATGHRKPKGISAWEDNFKVSGGALTTARMEWFPDHIVFTLMNGAQPMGTVADVIKTETYKSDATDIPQVTAPVGINLWCFKQTPAEDQAVVIRKFEFADTCLGPDPHHSREHVRVEQDHSSKLGAVTVYPRSSGISFSKPFLRNKDAMRERLTRGNAAPKIKMPLEVSCSHCCPLVQRQDS